MLGFGMAPCRSEQGKGARKSAEILNRAEPAFPVDVIVRTPRQMHERLADRDFFLRDVVKFTRAPIRREAERSGVACRLTPSAQT